MHSQSLYTLPCIQAAFVFKTAIYLEFKHHFFSQQLFLSTAKGRVPHQQKQSRVLSWTPFLWSYPYLTCGRHTKADSSSLRLSGSDSCDATFLWVDSATECMCCTNVLLWLQTNRSQIVYTVLFAYQTLSASFFFFFFRYRYLIDSSQNVRAKETVFTVL